MQQLSQADRAFAQGLLEHRQRDLAYAALYLRHGKNKELRSIAKGFQRQWKIEESRLLNLLDPQPVKLPMRVQRFPVDVN